MPGKNKKNVKDFFKLFVGSLIVFAVLLAAGVGGYLLATGGLNGVEATDVSVEAAISEQTSNQDIIDSEPDVTADSTASPTVAPSPSPPPQDDLLIAKNIYINNVSVGGLKKDQAEQLLKTVARKELAEKAVSFSDGEQSFDLYYGDIGATYDFKDAVEKAFQYTRDEDTDGKNIDLLKSEEHRINASVNYNPELLSVFLNSLTEKVNVPPKEPSMWLEDGEFAFAEGEQGKDADLEVAKVNASEILVTGNIGTVALTFLPTNPNLKVEDIQDCTSLLGAMTTSFEGKQSAPRNVNIANATSKINNYCMEPGEVFSTNYTLGEMTKANGYRVAKAILGGQYIDDIGGGVCQVASTLYNAVIRSELEIVQRVNHSRKVTYLDYAYDATLSTPEIDFKFKNNQDTPVLLVGYVHGNKVTFEIYGRETRPETRTIKFKKDHISTTPPRGERIKYDSSLPSGRRVVESSASTGHVYKLYKYVYENGELVDTILVNTSTYSMYPAVVRVGTGGSNKNSKKSTVSDYRSEALNTTSSSAQTLQPLPVETKQTTPAAEQPIQKPSEPTAQSPNSPPVVEQPIEKEQPKPDPPPEPVSPPAETTTGSAGAAE